MVLAKTSHRIGDIIPGDYVFSLGTGQLLWEVTLDEKDLFLTGTDPGKNLPLAADTDEVRRSEARREISLMDGELVVRVFAGLENGWIEIQERLSV